MHNEIVAFGSGGGGSTGRRAVNRASRGAAPGVARAIAGATGLTNAQSRRVNRLAQTGRATFRGATNRAITRRLRAPARR